MEAHIHEWTNLLVRWIHFIVGVAWIGASFYFNWLENNLDRKAPQEPGIAGNLWAIHGGGFYHLKKFSHGPDSLTPALHWFKWEAYTTWLSGFTLLVVVYYYNAQLFMVDPNVADLSPAAAIGIGLLSLFGSWFIYDGLCKSRLRNQPMLLSLLLLVYFSLLSFALCQIFSARAAYIHVGAAIGTIMVANVFFGIIPAQKEMVAALSESRDLDPKHGASGLLRSRHNNYLTLPVLFIMISSHFPVTYGHHWNWLILLVLSVLSVAVRHYFNIRHQKPVMIWVLPAAFAGFAALVWFTAPQLSKNAGPGAASGAASGAVSGAAPATADIQPIIKSRCSSCHAQNPTHPGFAQAPAGLLLETATHTEQNAVRIHQTAVISKIMPLANMTGITEEERSQLGLWFQGLSSTAPAID